MNDTGNVQRNDHDTLIRVETKVDQLVVDLKNMSDGILIRLIKTETRIDGIELYHAGIPLKTYDDNSKWVTSFRSNLKFILAVVTFIATILSGLIVLLLKKLLNF